MKEHNLDREVPKRKSYRFFEKKNTVYKAIPAYDVGYVCIVLTLLAFGFMMVYSATVHYPEPKSDRWYDMHYSVRYMYFVLFSLFGFVAVSSWVPLRFFKRSNMIRFVFWGTVIACLCVFIPGIGVTVNGASRWINLGVVRFQPSELAKLSIVICCAYYFDLQGSAISNSRSWWPNFMLRVGLIFVIILFQKDLGGTLVLAGIVFMMLWLAGFPKKYLFILVLLAVLLVVFAVMYEPYRLARFLSYRNPLDDQNIKTKGYQLAHSWSAIVQGGFWGQGLGGSIEKLNYLPEAHTDFIMSVVTEELGIVGLLFVIVLFFMLIRKIFLIGKDSAIQGERFHAYVAYGIGVWFCAQVCINLMVYTGVMPTKGLALPLVSYGGSAVLVNMLALGLVLRVDIENRCLMRGDRSKHYQNLQKPHEKRHTWRDFQI